MRVLPWNTHDAILLHRMSHIYKVTLSEIFNIQLIFIKTPTTDVKYKMHSLFDCG